VLRGLVVLLVIGLVPALGLSWIYELTPEGIKRDAGPLAADLQSSDTGRKLNWATLAVAIFAIGFMATDRMRPAPPVVAPIAAPATAVIPAPTADTDTDTAVGSDTAIRSMLHRSRCCPSPTCPRRATRRTSPTGLPKRFSTR
jgi:adenylate cyclase